MRKYLLNKISILIYFSCLLIACKTNAPVSFLEEPSTQQFQFPQDWIGSYAGFLHILDKRNQAQKVEMKLTIGPPDAQGMYQWIIQYGDDDKRYYGLEAINAELGHYRIDEYNSIKLDAYLKGDNLISTFSLMDRNITYHYEKKIDGIEIQVFFNRTAPISTSGKEIIGQDTVPEVHSYHASGYQSGFLRQLTPQ